MKAVFSLRDCLVLWKKNLGSILLGSIAFVVIHLWVDGQLLDPFRMVLHAERSEVYFTLRVPSALISDINSKRAYWKTLYPDSKSFYEMLSGPFLRDFRKKRNEELSNDIVSLNLAGGVFIDAPELLLEIALLLRTPDTKSAICLIVDSLNDAHREILEEFKKQASYFPKKTEGRSFQFEWDEKRGVKSFPKPSSLVLGVLSLLLAWVSAVFGMLCLLLLVEVVLPKKSLR